MPYTWTDDHSELHLWPHQSLPPEGFVIFMGATSLLITVPLVPLFGTVLLWGLLPFLALAVAGLWFALNRHCANNAPTNTLQNMRNNVKWT